MEEWVQKVEQYEHKCARCGVQQDDDIVLQADHIIPLSLGGHDEIENIQPLCHACNSSKNATVHNYKTGVTDVVTERNTQRLLVDKREIRGRGEGEGEKSFALFWKSYPRIVGKPAARKAWSKVKPEEIEGLMAGLEIWKRCPQWTDEQFIPHPATWLNQRRWEDNPAHVKAVEALRPAPTGPNIRVRPDALERSRQREALAGKKAL
jgi:hypothetical protein